MEKVGRGMVLAYVLVEVRQRACGDRRGREGRPAPHLMQRVQRLPDNIINHMHGELENGPLAHDGVDDGQAFRFCVRRVRTHRVVEALDAALGSASTRPSRRL